MSDLPEQMRDNAREWDISECPQRAEIARRAAARIEELEALVNSLDIQCRHPSMDGRHQCSIRANGRALSVEQWDTILSCRSKDGAS
jgi:hypothetical protein